MTTGHKITVALAVVLAVVLGFAGYGWLREHEAALVVNAQVQADAVAAARIEANEAENKAALADALKGYEALRATVQTPAQVVKALPQVIQLPAPIVQVTAAQAKAANDAALPDAPRLGAGDLLIPASDAKAFYDAQLDCKVTAAKELSCRQTVANDVQLAQVKDAEVAQLKVALKGGTKWQRAGRALKTGFVGALVGAGVTAYLVRR